MDKAESKIQKIELTSGDIPHCPFCGQRPITGIGAEIHQLAPCGHTLFIATDAGFEYRSYAFDAAMGIVAIAAGDLPVGEAGYDAYTDAVRINNAVKFAVYGPAPSFFGAYFGFAKLD